MGVIYPEFPLSNIWTSFVLIMRQQHLFAITTSPLIHLVCPPLPHKKYKPFVFSFSWVLQWSHEELKTMLMQSFGGQTRCIIIRSKFFFLFIGQERTTWPPNNCLQIMVCSCAMPSNCVWLQIIFCTCVKETVLFSYLRSLLRENDRSLRFQRIFIKKQTRRSNDKTIIERGYYLPQPSASANNWSSHHRQIAIICSTSSTNC